MAEARKTMTEMDQPDAPDEENQDDKRGRRLFGRPRERAPREMRSETEWVDTLVAHQEQEQAIPAPFAAPAPTTESSPFAGLDETQAVPPEPLYTSSDHEWRRRQNEPLDTIHQFIDNVLGTENDPRRRLQRRAVEYGLHRTFTKQGREVSSVAVEGLDKELLIAFTFPQDEFRGARVIYETEGGYVVEVRRALGGRDDDLTTQHYTVSRVGEVGHVLDKLRASEAAPRHHEPVPPAPAPRAPIPEPVPEPPAPLESEPPAPPAPAPSAPRVDTKPHDEGDTAEAAEPGAEKRGFGFLRRKGHDDDVGASDASHEEDHADAEQKGRFAGLTGRFRRKGKEGADETAPEM